MQTTAGLPRLAVGSMAWLPVGLLVAAAAAPSLRLFVLVGLAVGAATAVARAGVGRPAGAGVAWLAALPIAVSLAIGTLPDVVVRDAAACDDLPSLPVLRLAIQAVPALAVVALLAPRLGGAASLGLVRPADRRVTALVLATPVLVPLGIVLGPPLAEPFFGPVGLGLPVPAALAPAALYAVLNAVLEEVLYRGALQRWGAIALGRRGALVAQALVFGAAHLGSDVLAGGPLLWVGLAAAGLVAGLVAERTGSLALPIAAHAAFDVPLALARTCRLA